MTKKERDKIVNNDDPFCESPASFFTRDQISADIAYQLTRIADAVESLANPLIQVDKEGVLRPVPAKPAPDASGPVDAVENALSAFRKLSLEKGIHHPKVCSLLESALATLKPEVEK